jgi:hypothetical protein
MKPNRRVLKNIAVVATWVLIAIVVGAIHAEGANYNITKISNNNYKTFDLDINNLGQIAWASEIYDNMNKIYLYSNGNIVPIPNGDNYFVQHISINDNGEIVWVSERGASLYRNGNTTIIAGGGENPRINNKGHVVYSKYSPDDMGDSHIGLYLNINGTETQISDAIPPEVYAINAIEINDKGQIAYVGYTATSGNLYFYDNGTITKITNSPLLMNFKINNHGQIVWGGENENGDIDIKLWEPGPNGGTITNIYTGNGVSGVSLNDLGQVVWSMGDSIYEWNLNNPSVSPTLVAQGVLPIINNMGQIAYLYADIGSIYYNVYLATPQVEVAKQIYALCIGLKKDFYIIEGGYRPDLGAKLISEKLNNLTNQDNIRYLQGDISTIGLSKNEIKTAINILKNKMKTGDLFILYIHTHGGTFETIQGTETTKSTGDEFVEIGSSQDGTPYPEGALADNELKSYLEGMDDISKWVIIDACHSGGFWGNNNSTDAGDLEKLKKIGLLAACGEDEITTFIPYSYGIFTKGLAQAFSFNQQTRKLNADVNQDGVLTFNELYIYMNFYWPLSEGFKSLIGDVVYEAGFGEVVTFSSDLWKPYAAKNDGLEAIKTFKDISPIIYMLLAD